MLQQHQPFENDDCPVSDQFIAELYGSNAAKVDVMVASVDPAVRAMLALYCYRRSHLFDNGLLVASACEADHLIHYGGRSGGALIAAASGRCQQFQPKASSRPKITLSRGKLRDMGPLEDDDTDVGASPCGAPS